MNEQMEKEIIRLYSELAKRDPTSDEYEKLMKRLRDLNQMHIDQENTYIECEKVSKSRWLTPNDILSAATNLVGIGLILNHERLNVISTKAIGFVKKLKF